MSENREYGDCYRSSYEGASDLLQIKSEAENGNSSFDALYEKLSLQNDVEIVHGWVVPVGGLDDGRRVIHAWIEAGETAIETSLGQKKPFVKRKYYDDLTVEVCARYSFQEAEKKLIETGKFMAWHENS